jgi:hypothetical protein
MHLNVVFLPKTIAQQENFYEKKQKERLTIGSPLYCIIGGSSLQASRVAERMMDAAPDYSYTGGGSEHLCSTAQFQECALLDRETYWTSTVHNRLSMESVEWNFSL